jgi:hypothetical protein
LFTFQPGNLFNCKHSVLPKPLIIKSPIKCSL